MIAPMKKILLLVLQHDRDEALEAIRKCGVVEVVSESLADSGDRAALAQKIANLTHAIGALESVKAQPGKIAGDAAEAALAAIEQQEALAREAEALQKEVEELTPWGNFDAKAIAELAKNGIFVTLCAASDVVRDELEDAHPEWVFVDCLEAPDVIYFAVIAREPLAAEDLPRVALPEHTLTEAQTLLDANAKAQTELQTALAALAAELPALQAERGHLEADLQLLEARDGMENAGEITVLRGFVPARDLAKVEKLAATCGWGVLSSDPEPGDAVPVLLDPPRWVKPVLPLFSFLGIAPGYDEFDMSPGMLIFFSIFFSMIVNDAGYGLVFFAMSLVAAILLRKNHKAALPCKLALILSGCATAWGVATGSYFGVAAKSLPFFASGPSQMQNLMLVCFVLALTHLSLGHLWKMLYLQGLRNRLGQIGWIMILVLDFLVVVSLLVKPGMSIPLWGYVSGGVGLALVFIGGIDWRDVGAVCNFPFDLIGSFTDTLSYVRLFAVGMSGAYMASSFNGMGTQLLESSPWLILPAVLVILFGHTLNVALTLMSVLVHGVRLNTLEFSNHAGIRWGGQAYKPLKEFEK